MKFADVLGAFKPREKRVTLVGAGSLLAEHEELSRQLAVAMDQRASRVSTASLSDVDPVRELAGRIAELEPLIEASRVTFTLRGLGWNEYQQLVREHSNADGELDTDAFAPVLVARCAIDPAMSLDEVGQLAAVLTQGDFARLYYAAVEASVEADGVPFNKLASAVISGSGER